MKILLTTGIFLVTYSALFGQAPATGNGKITGIVRDSTNAQPVA
ncbi:MAG: hypothetical protein ACKO1F_17175 [Flammeovirgaceae bacterium]